MNYKNKKILGDGKTNLLVLLCCVYAFFVCYCCYIVLNDQIDFGVVASANAETVWRVSQ